jgi:aminotransferase
MTIGVSTKAGLFTESVIREMTRLCNQRAGGEPGINLAQGFPDFAAPEEVKEAACRAIRADVNQYAVTWGAKDLREALARKMRRFQGVDVDPERQICVTCGATEAMLATLLAIVDTGGEVVIFEPFYENYGPDAILSGATPRFVRLREPDWSFDPQELARAFNERTRAIIVNTPHNPTGKVFTRDELGIVADLCRKWDAVAITDEIYEHILYDGAEHVPLATLPGMADRTVTISGLSKTFSVTGWRVGWTIAPPELTDGIRKVHDFVTVGAAAPLQAAGAVALEMADAYYEEMTRAYHERRAVILPLLESAGFVLRPPEGAYYVMTDISGFGVGPGGRFPDDVAFARWLVKEAGVAAVPGSSFFHRPEDGRGRLRFSFSKKLDTLRAAGERLARLPDMLKA